MSLTLIALGEHWGVDRTQEMLSQVRLLDHGTPSLRQFYGDEEGLRGFSIMVLTTQGQLIGLQIGLLITASRE